MSTQHQNKKAVHFGAGNIGRGFVACFLHNSGYEVVFADVADSLIDKLNETPSYRVIEVGAEGTNENTITNYRAINSRTHEADLVEEIATADVVTCSVGPNILKFIAPQPGSYRCHCLRKRHWRHRHPC
ncbi:mannitol-1-phosphate 5-dehydrogenase [Colletotrichum higginsianum]|uniref:Mannitol-1-phosphate 5-dehydrogenase n=1 Tax=Colletotrichum higginsianum (strain IMI 349063) TaxID=759273 RepID=H1V1E8_COLHI|nr:mannitol-1-phosphate 5-dehydrogenase [Colletotrichum higginsianum]